MSKGPIHFLPSLDAKEAPCGVQIENVRYSMAPSKVQCEKCQPTADKADEEARAAADQRQKANEEEASPRKRGAAKKAAAAKK